MKSQSAKLQNHSCPQKGEQGLAHGLLMAAYEEDPGGFRYVLLLSFGFVGIWGFILGPSGFRDVWAGCRAPWLR